MNSDAAAKLLVAIIVVIIVVMIARSPATNSEDKRRRDLAALAKKLQLEFNFKSDFDLPKRFSFLSWLKQGVASYAYNIFHGYYRLEYPVTIFDYTFSDAKYSYY